MQERGVSVEYNVHAREKDQFVGAGRADAVFKIKNPEGFKYCFEVPTTFLLFRHNGYIFASGNTGKTLVEIKDFAQRHKKDGKRLLVLCPKSLMRAAWYQDIGKFAPHLRVSLCYANKRKESLAVDADVFVVNVDGVKDLVKITDKAFWKKFGTLVIDESDAFMHHTSQRSKAAVKVRQHFDYVRLLSATPQGNTICDQWHQYYLLDKGKRLGKSFFGFRSACCTPKQSGPKAAHLTWTDKPDIELVVAELVKDITIRHKFEDCVDIPAIHTYTMSFELNTKHMAAYNEMKNEALMVIKDEVVTAVNAAVVAQKLLQIASGAVYDGQGKYVKVASERYELILDLVCDRPHCVVFYTWEHQLEELIAEAKARKISWVAWDPDEPTIVDDFQAGKYRVIFAHPASAAHGLTLTKATAVIWASPTFNVRHFIQGTKRIHRIGQKQKTENIVIVAEGTADEKAFESMQRKEANLIKFLSELE